MGWVDDERAKGNLNYVHSCLLPVYGGVAGKAWQCDDCQRRWVLRGNYSVSRYDLRGQSYAEQVPVWESLPPIEWPPKSVEAAEEYLEAAGGKTP